MMSKLLFALFLAMLIVSPAGAYSPAHSRGATPVVMAPGYIEALSCADSATMPVINWTAKGALQIVDLHQSGDCRLSATWDATLPGLYCTGIGTLENRDWIPDACIHVAARVYLPLIVAGGVQ